MFQAFGQLIISAALTIAGFFGYHQALLGGAAATVYTPAPRYESSLALALTATQTSSMSLVSGVDGNGVTLSGPTCFTIDSGVANSVEDVCGVASGTVVTNLLRGIDTSGVTASSTLAHAHRVGADVKITDSPYLAQYYRLLNGIDSFPNPLSYSSSVTTSTLTGNGQNFASVNYVNGTAVSGAPNGSPSVKGIYQEANTSTIAAGTTVGTTGADLALTQNTASTTSKSYSVVEANASGTIDNSWFNLTTLASLIVPPGTIEAYTTSSAPTGWLLANGQLVSTSTYPSLFALIGYAYGGSTSTFGIPNLGGRFLAGASSTLSSTIGATGGATSTVITQNNLPSYTPAITGGPAQDVGGSGGAQAFAGSGVGGGTAFSFTSYGTASPQAVTTTPPYFIVNYIIKF